MSLGLRVKRIKLAAASAVFARRLVDGILISLDTHAVLRDLGAPTRGPR